MSVIARQHILQSLLKEHEADALFLTFLPDIRWSCGFTGSNGLLVVLPDAVHFVSDGRYEEQAHREVEGATIHIPGYELYDYLAKSSLLSSARRIIFQSDHVSYQQVASWQSSWEEVSWVPLTNILSRYVASKTTQEINAIRRAQRITEQVFEEILGLIEPGVSELTVAAEIVYRHLQKGASKMSFDPIVASGPNGALPHARPSSRTIAQGDLVVLDFGCFFEGYASDMTRTVAIGQPNDEQQRVYQIVLDAQEEAISKARAGMTTKNVDALARNIISTAGYGTHFNHGLGHGIGLQTHEWPRVSFHVDDVLPSNSTVTIEPGIYLPSKFGVRIEDIVVLHDDGTENLTSAPKELIVL